MSKWAGQCWARFWRYAKKNGYIKKKHKGQYIFQIEKKFFLTGLAENRYIDIYNINIKINMCSSEELDRCNVSHFEYLLSILHLRRGTVNILAGLFLNAYMSFSCCWEKIRFCGKIQNYLNVWEKTQKPHWLYGLPSKKKNKFPLSSIINIKQASDVSPYASDSCYLGTPLGCLSEFATCERLYGNPKKKERKKNLVQNPYLLF